MWAGQLGRAPVTKQQAGSQHAPAPCLCAASSSQPGATIHDLFTPERGAGLLRLLPQQSQQAVECLNGHASENEVCGRTNFPGAIAEHCNWETASDYGGGSRGKSGLSRNPNSQRMAVTGLVVHSARALQSSEQSLARWHGCLFAKVKAEFLQNSECSSVELLETVGVLQLATQACLCGYCVTEHCLAVWSGQPPLACWLRHL